MKQNALNAAAKRWINQLINLRLFTELHTSFNNSKGMKKIWERGRIWVSWYDWICMRSSSLFICKRNTFMKSLLAEMIFGFGMKCDQIHKPTKKIKSEKIFTSSNYITTKEIKLNILKRPFWKHYYYFNKCRDQVVSCSFSFLSTCLWVAVTGFVFGRSIGSVSPSHTNSGSRWGWRLSLLP